VVIDIGKDNLMGLGMTKYMRFHQLYLRPVRIIDSGWRIFMVGPKIMI
jgi:hypothetical protein